jgi:hypothetical protein
MSNVGPIPGSPSQDASRYCNGSCYYTLVCVAGSLVLSQKCGKLETKERGEIKKHILSDSSYLLAYEDGTDRVFRNVGI